MLKGCKCLSKIELELLNVLWVGKRNFLPIPWSAKQALQISIYKHNWFPYTSLTLAKEAINLAEIPSYLK